MENTSDTALTLIQLLMNAAGAEFEDSSLAHEIVTETLYKKQFNFRPLKNYPLEADKKYLLVLDYRPWGRSLSIEIGKSFLAKERTLYGGPNALTGHGYIEKGEIYFAIPAILHPNVVTHYIPIPENIEEIL